MVEVRFPISEIKRPKLKVRPLWTKVDFNGGCPQKEKCGQTQRHAEEDVMWGQSQRLKWCVYRQRNTKNCTQRPELHTRPGTVVPYNLQRDHDPAQTLTLNFQPLALWEHKSLLLWAAQYVVLAYIIPGKLTGLHWQNQKWVARVPSRVSIFPWSSGPFWLIMFLWTSLLTWPIPCLGNQAKHCVSPRQRRFSEIVWEFSMLWLSSVPPPSKKLS